MTRAWRYIIHDTRKREYFVNLEHLEDVWSDIVVYLKDRHLLNILDKGYFVQSTSPFGDKHIKRYVINNNIPPFKITIVKRTTGDIDIDDFINTRNRVINKHTD